MRIPRSIVITGGGLAAARAVEEVRRLGLDSSITLVCGESHAPYDRPPLSKEVLRGERRETPLRADWSDLDVDLRLGRRAVALHPSEQTVLLDDGETLGYDALVVATGAQPRTLAGVSGSGAHVLRTLEDSHALAEDIRRAGRLTVVGGGLIGCEVAASARALGADVTLLEILAAPLARIFGAQVAAEVARMHENAGVRLLCGTSVVEARGEGAERELLLSDGTTLSAPVVLVGLGVQPETAWLEGSGLEVDNGVLCDATGRTSLDGVWAAGDVARWEHPLLGAHVRMEHWTSAANQGVAAARDLAGQPTALDEVPYFWSDQYRTKFQVLGWPHPDDEVTLLRVGPDADRLLALYGRDGRLTAVLGASAPRWVMRMRSMVGDRAPYDEALAAARA
ncbi:MAG: Reductase C-terminal [Arthrobacter sp.]|jgi:3-phenylpropionate/trans-cinnamate dioxygenase ferredoxin reductase subunit|nr:Reductase C-terminal [Arthrobacter sp.]